MSDPITLHPHVTVVGSIAVRLALRAARLPAPGESLPATDFELLGGGKGCLQAVQAARLGADTQFVGCVGEDDFARIALDLLARQGVGSTFLARTAERHTGAAFSVRDHASGSFVLFDRGANALFSPADVDAAAARIQSSHALLTQLEIPVETAAHALRLAKRAGSISILDPAPATALPPEVLSCADLITPNEAELRILLGLEPDDPTASLDLCQRLLTYGVARVILTRDEQGTLVVTEDGYVNIPAPQVEVVDTTGVGDAFNGALATYLGRGMPLEPAVRHAVAAGALACTKAGGIPALPDMDAVEQLLAHP